MHVIRRAAWACLPPPADARRTGPALAPLGAGAAGYRSGQTGRWPGWPRTKAGRAALPSSAMPPCGPASRPGRSSSCPCGRPRAWWPPRSGRRGRTGPSPMSAPPLPRTEDPGRPDPLTAHLWPAEPAGPLSGHADRYPAGRRTAPATCRARPRRCRCPGRRVRRNGTRTGPTRRLDRVRPGSGNASARPRATGRRPGGAIGSGRPGTEYPVRTLDGIPRFGPMNESTG